MTKNLPFLQKKNLKVLKDTFPCCKRLFQIERENGSNQSNLWEREDGAEEERETERKSRRGKVAEEPRSRKR